MNEQRLIDGMKKSGVSLDEMQNRLGISRTAFYRKRKGITQFTVKEMGIILRVLPPEYRDIFFDDKVS